jgi:hypothetical protein
MRSIKRVAAVAAVVAVASLFGWYFGLRGNHGVGDHPEYENQRF